jgi:hypothetical protein
MPQTPGAPGRDFAGLLDALAAPQPGAGPLMTPLPDAAMPEMALLPDPAAPRPEALPAAVIAGWPGGKNLPEPGAQLPPAAPASLAALPVAALRPAVPGQDGAEPAMPPRAALSADAPLAASDAPRTPPPAGQADSLIPDAPVRMMPGDAEPVIAGETWVAEPQAALATDPESPEDPALAETLATAPAPLPPLESAPLAAVLAALPAPAPVAMSALTLAANAEPRASRIPAARVQAAATPADRAAFMAKAWPAATSPAPASAPAGGVPPVSEGAAPLAALDAPLAAALNAPLDAPLNSGAPAPAPASLAAAPLTAAPLQERPPEPRASAAGPQIESAIAQVGDIREALRAARPAMTLQHAEFGMVSLRLEPAAPDQWRAVLASRDPGFIPAIHAALDARAIAAAGETATNFTGQNGAPQNGTSDQRYGASPNGGQGSSQPYLGQSGSRDGEAAPDHRRPSTAAALAARGEGEAEDPAGRAHGPGGLFA